jgi:hypothetical protein
MSHNEAGSWAWVPADEAAAPLLGNPPTRRLEDPVEGAYRSLVGSDRYSINGTSSADVVEFLIDQDDGEFHTLMAVVSFRRYVRYGRVVLLIGTTDL